MTLFLDPNSPNTGPYAIGSVKQTFPLFEQDTKMLVAACCTIYRRRYTSDLTKAVSYIIKTEEKKITRLCVCMNSHKVL